MVVWYDHVPFTDLMRFAMSAALEKGCDVAIVGGAKVFELGMFWASELILTEIQKDYEGDVFFPEIQEDKFKLVSELYHEDEPELVWKLWRRKCIM
jgi:dihydrofolate reductase